MYDPKTFSKGQIQANKHISWTRIGLTEQEQLNVVRTIVPQAMKQALKEIVGDPVEMARVRASSEFKNAMASVQDFLFSHLTELPFGQLGRGWDCRQQLGVTSPTTLEQLATINPSLTPAQQQEMQGAVAAVMQALARAQPTFDPKSIEGWLTSYFNHFVPASIAEGKAPTVEGSFAYNARPEFLQGHIAERAVAQRALEQVTRALPAGAQVLASVLAGDAHTLISEAERKGALSTRAIQLGAVNKEIDCGLYVRLTSGAEFVLWLEVKSSEKGYSRIAGDLFKSMTQHHKTKAGLDVYSIQEVKAALEQRGNSDPAIKHLPVITLAVPIQMNTARWQGNNAFAPNFLKITSMFDIVLGYSQTRPIFRRP